MRISDWSSGVCSSDLRGAAPETKAHRRVAVAADVVGDALLLQQGGDALGRRGLRLGIERAEPGIDALQADRGAGARLRSLGQNVGPRSDERRVGKEWVRKCRYRRSPYH